MDPVVVRDPDILGGTPVFAGTRVPARTLVDYLAAGDDLAAADDDGTDRAVPSFACLCRLFDGRTHESVVVLCHVFSPLSEGSCLPDKHVS